MRLMGRWIDEEKEETLCDDFGVGPGDIYRHVESAEWLLYTAGCIAELNHYKKLTFVLENLRRRVRYGIREELLELAGLHGVGRIRARQLFSHGYHKLNDLQFATVDQLGTIKSIGKALARDIVTQAHAPALKPRYSSKHTLAAEESEAEITE